MRNKIMRKLSIIFCAFFSLQANKSNAENISGKYLHKFAPKSDKIKIYKKLGIAAGVTTTVAIGGLLGSYAYKNSDNVFQRKLIGSSDKIREINADDLTNIKKQKIEIDKMQGYIYSSPDNVSNGELFGKYVIFYSGSGSSNTFQIPDVAEEYVRQGAVVIGVDYMGFGESGDKISSGKIREKDIYNDGFKIYNHVINNMKINPENIIIHGYSLGGPVAAHVVALALKGKKDLGGLVLQSSMKNTSNAVYELLKNENQTTRLLGTLGGYLFADSFDCVKELKNIYKQNPDIPIAICGGGESDHLRLEQTKLDVIAKEIGFKNLNVHNGEKEHILDEKAPKENFKLPNLNK